LRAGMSRAVSKRAHRGEGAGNHNEQRIQVGNLASKSLRRMTQGYSILAGEIAP
jgi:hypothetical protein